MLQLINVCKSYTAADFTQTALDHVSVAFRDNEFVAVLGPSGSGKTTILLRLLDQLKGRRVGVIQNEFGKLGIDGTILRDDDIKMVEISAGPGISVCGKLRFG